MSPTTPGSPTHTLNRNELASMLRVSLRTLDRLRHDPRFPKPLPKPGVPRWSVQTVKRYLESA